MFIYFMLYPATWTPRTLFKQKPQLNLITKVHLSGPQH